MPLRRFAARADLRLLEVFYTRRALAALPLSAALFGAVAGGQTAPPAKGKAAPPKSGTIQAPFSPLPPPPGSKSTGGILPPAGTTPFPAPPTLPPAGPPLPPPPTLPRRVSLTGAVPPAMQAQIASLDIDAATIEGALPVLWRGTAYGAGSPPGASSSPDSISRKLALLRKASGARLARISPFAVPGVVLPGADGVPIARWDDIDAMLQRAAGRHEEVIFSLQPPPAWTESAWNALIALTLRRYRTNPPAAILRWELRGDAVMAPARYAAFARQCRALYPSAPLGIFIASGDVGEGTRRIAQICAASRVPLDSVAWRLPSDAAGAAGAARQVRAALGAYPALKGTLLLPTLGMPRAQDDVSDVSSRLVSLCARLIEAAPAAPPNPLGGLLVEDESIESGDSGGRISRDDGGENAADGDTALQATAALALLNRITGTRVTVRNGGAGIGCLASQNGTHTYALLWREADTRRDGSHAGQSEDAPVLVRLHHLTAGPTGLRITRSATGEMASAPVAVNSSTASGDAASGSLLGRMTADIPAAGNYLPGELEVTTLLAPGEVCLLDIAPRDAPPPLLQTTLSVAGADLRGGDPFEVVLSARNLSANARALDAVLTSSIPNVLPQTNVRLTLGTLPAGGARSFRFTLRAPVAASSGTLTLGAQTEDARSLITLPILPALEAGLETARADVATIGGTATLRARLVNRGRAPLTARLHVGLGTPVEVTVAPGGFKTVALAVAPPLPAPGLYPVTVRVESASRTLSSLPAQIGVPFACPHVQTTPAIDGDLGEWTGDTPLGMGRAEQAHGKPWGGPSDISAYAYTRWDARYFYFACAVTDDVFIPPRNASQLEQGDSVFVALSADSKVVPLGNGAGTNAAGANKAGRQDRSAAQTAVFGMALMQNAKGGLEPTLVRLSPQNGAGGRVAAQSVQDGRVAIRRDGSRVFYEAAIPWSRILVAAPQSGQTLGLSILVNDTDSAAGKGQNPRRGTMEWGGGLAGRIQPLLFPPLRLTR